MYPGQSINEHIGTPAYLAPEIIKEKGYSGFKSDIWSLGIMSYIALTGIVPFKGNTVDQLNHNIQNVDVDFESSKIKLSEKMKKLLK
jgi:serine/threonine protein kinase